MLNLDFLRRSSKKDTPSPSTSPSSRRKDRDVATTTGNVAKRPILKAGDLPDESARTPTPHRGEAWRPESWVSDDNTSNRAASVVPPPNAAAGRYPANFDVGYNSDAPTHSRSGSSRRRVTLPVPAQANASYEGVAPFGLLHQPQPKSGVPSRGWGRSPIPGAIAARFLGPNQNDLESRASAIVMERTRSRTASQSSYTASSRPTHARHDSSQTSVSPSSRSSRTRTTSHSSPRPQVTPPSSTESTRHYSPDAGHSRSRHNSEVHSTRPVIGSYQSAPVFHEMMESGSLPVQSNLNRRYSENGRVTKTSTPAPEAARKRGATYPGGYSQSVRPAELPSASGYSTDDDGSKKKGILKPPRETAFPVPKTPEDLKRMLSPVPLEHPPDKVLSSSERKRTTSLRQQEEPIVNELRPHTFPVLICDMREDVQPAKNIRKIVPPRHWGQPPTLKALSMTHLEHQISLASTKDLPFQEMTLSFCVRDASNVVGSPLRWKATIYAKRGLRYLDLFEKAYDCLHETLDKTRDAKYIADPEVIRAHRVRCREGSQLEQVELKCGPRRVDVLKGAHYFDGIYFEPERKRWIMLLSPKEKYLAYGLKIPPCFNSYHS